jgi:HEAT repeat protein
MIAAVGRLLDDPHDAVRQAAACALGRMGSPAGRATLLGLLRQEPSAEIIEAVALVADEDCLVVLGKLARDRADLADAVLAVLDDSDLPRAARIAKTIRASRQVGGKEE